MNKMEIGKSYETKCGDAIRCVAQLKSDSPYPMLCIGLSHVSGNEIPLEFSPEGVFEDRAQQFRDVKWPGKMEMGKTYSSVRGKRIEVVAVTDNPEWPIVGVVRGGLECPEKSYDIVRVYACDGECSDGQGYNVQW